ncbi:MAG: hypothetical protein ACJ74J_08125 [Blastocatellia bacterium]
MSGSGFNRLDDLRSLSGYFFLTFLQSLNCISYESISPGKEKCCFSGFFRYSKGGLSLPFVPMIGAAAPVK